jgi:O-antigen/teichoic acid export membrane protein
MSEAAKPGLIGQTLIAFAGNSSGYVVAILTGIVVARVLGPAGKGVASYAALVMALFTTFGYGLQSAVMYECGRNGRPQILVYGAALRLLGLAMLPTAAALLVLAWFDPRHAAFIYVACAIPFAVYTQITNGIFLLHNDVRSNVIAGMIPTFGVALFTIPALTFFHGGLTAVLAIWAAMFGASAIFTLIRLNAYLPALALGESDWSLLREQAWFSLKAGSTSLASFLNLRIDVFVVSFMLDARTLGIYTLAVASGELMWQVSRPLAATTNGRIAAGDRARAVALTCTVARNILAVEFVLGIAIFALAPLAVRFVYGSAYAESGSVMRWLLPGVIVYAAQAPLSYFVTVKDGRPMAALAIQVSSVVCCALISVLTIRWLNIYGAALATSVTYCCAAAASSFIFARSAGVPAASFMLLQREDLERFRRLLGRLVPSGRGMGGNAAVKSC